MRTEKKLPSGIWRRNAGLSATLTIILFVFLISPSCQKSSNVSPETADRGAADLAASSGSNNWKQVNLVSDVAGGAQNQDPNLVNAWGLAFGSTGIAWISSNEEGLTTVYDDEGNTVLAPVTIDFNGSPANPTGAVFNNTSTFNVPGTGSPAIFIFATENGSLNAWNGGSSAPMVADESSDSAVYKGLAIAATGGTNYIYATNFRGAKIDVFDGNFDLVNNISLIDATIPAGYAPFGIRNIGGQLWVTYAKQLKPDDMDDDAGPGHGFVDIFDPSGTLIGRFASHGVLNSPWGIAKKPGANMYLIGNFGDGKINVFDNKGNLITGLKSNGKIISIDGLWAIDFPTTIPESDRGRLYFTAGPEGESHGLFGYLTPQ